MSVEVGFLILLLVAPGPAARQEAAPPASTRVLLDKLRAAGRAEVTVRLQRHDPVTGRTVVLGGRLALELPRLARLDLEDGERLTLREDGGDWLQPATRQLVRAGARTTSGLLAWCGALLEPGERGIVERKLGPREYSLTPADAAEALPQRLELGSDRLPRRVVVALSADETIEYRLSRWRFVRGRGRSDFVLEAPPGIEVVEMP